jgi:hypothetical protein
MRRINAMHDWCREQVGVGGFATTGRLDRRTLGDHVRFHFRDPDVARRFWLNFMSGDE